MAQASPFEFDRTTRNPYFVPYCKPVIVTSSEYPARASTDCISAVAPSSQALRPLRKYDEYSALIESPALPTFFHVSFTAHPLSPSEPASTAASPVILAGAVSAASISE